MNKPMNPRQLDLVVRFTGRAGDGVQTAGELFSRAAAWSGLHVRGARYHSPEIRGGHVSAFQARISEVPVYTAGGRLHGLVSLHDPSAIGDLFRLGEHGAVFFDSRPAGFVEEDQSIAGFIEPGMSGYGIPFRELSAQTAGGRQSRNLVALGAVAWIFRLHPDAFEEAVRERFHHLPVRALRAQVEAFHLGYSTAGERLAKTDPFHCDFQSRPQRAEHRLLDVWEALAEAVEECGVPLVAAPPHSAAAEILHRLNRPGRKWPGKIVPAEDALAAAGFALGAGWGLAPGLALAGSGEFPETWPVLRLAAAAGLPLVLVVGADQLAPAGMPAEPSCHGREWPLAVPGSPAELRQLLPEAWRLAERGRWPVILRLDRELVRTIQDVPVNEPVRTADGPSDVTGPEPDLFPLRRPGIPAPPGALTLLPAGGSGLPDYRPAAAAAWRQEQTRRREWWRDHLPPPRLDSRAGSSELGIISPGPAANVIRAAMSRAGLAEGRVALLTLLWQEPFPVAAVRTFAADCRRTVIFRLEGDDWPAELRELAGGQQMHCWTGSPDDPGLEEKLRQAFLSLPEVPREL